MSKTLTEQWREGTLSMGYYYVSTPPSYGGEAIRYLDDDCSFGLGEDIIQEVLAPVPSYDEYKELLDLNVYEKLQKQLKIATKALKKYMTFCRHPAEEALKEMEGVK